MKTLIAIALLGLLGTTALDAPPLREGPGEGAEPNRVDEQAAITSTFLTLDITIDPQGQPLGAYQFELTSDDASFTVVGVEAGEHSAFDHGRPPYFDPVAKQGGTDHLILADYAKPALQAEALPAKAVRVATVHLMLDAPINGNEQPAVQLTLTAAGNAGGERINAQISHTFRNPERPE